MTNVRAGLRLTRAWLWMVALLVGTTSASAAPILVPTAPGVIASIIVQTNGTSTPDDDIFAMDVRGTTLGVVVEQTTGEFLGGSWVIGADPVPSSHLTLFSGDFSQALDIFLGFPGALLPPIWQTLALGVPAGTVTDPALIGFSGLLLVQFSLPCAVAADCVIPTTDGYMVPFVLDFIASAGDPVTAVPEPATLLLTVAGLAVIARARRRHTR